MKDNYYVYYYKDGKYIFDRTFDYLRDTENRVKELNKKYEHSTFTLNHLIKGAYY